MGDEGDARWLRCKPTPAKGRPVRLVDLFAGSGGLSLGVQEAARQLGRLLEVRFAVESERLAAASYAKAFGLETEDVLGDVTDVLDGVLGRYPTYEECRLRERVGSVDILVGGPPCQGHSTLNNHTRGDDPKNELYLRMVRAVQILAPRTVIIENVPAVTRDSVGVVERTIELLERVGYWHDSGVIDVSRIGVPQTRRRHVLVADRTRPVDLDAMVRDATVDELRTVGWALEDLVEGKGAFDGPPVMSPANEFRARMLFKNDLYDLPAHVRPACQQGKHKYKSMYGRLRWDEPAQTVTTGYGSPGQGRYIHPKHPRTLTAHEAARLQFFPDWFDFSMLTSRAALSRAIGNAVPPKLSFVLARTLLKR